VASPCGVASHRTSVKMSLFSDSVMRHQEAAVKCWSQGKHREAATHYWLSFRAISNPTHEFRYYIFHGYTSILRLASFEATDDDVKNVEQIFRDKHELRLFRLEAAFALGIVMYKRSERLKCQEIYYRAIKIGEQQPKNAKQERLEQKKMVLVSSAAGDQTSKTIKELMDGNLKTCRDNLNNLRSNAVHGYSNSLASKHHVFPVGRGGTTLTNHEVSNLMDIGGFHCDCCKREGEELLVCNGCKKAYYCSAECQKRQWKENGHKIHCRKYGEFKAGDLVQIARLKTKTDLNEKIMRVVGPDKNNEGRYEVRIEGAVRGDPSYSLAAANLNQLRPYDCRK